MILWERKSLEKNKERERGGIGERYFKYFFILKIRNNIFLMFLYLRKEFFFFFVGLEEEH